MQGLCRDCFHASHRTVTGGRCPECASPRWLVHPELFSLSIAHIDCDAFYASVEKRDNPELENVPLIIGDGKRGIVSTACYIARINGVHSAQPMFKALKACSGATVMSPNMSKYTAVSRDIRDLMDGLTPLIEPLSLDEAFLDLSGTERLHGGPPVESLARLTGRIEQEVGVTVSVGLASSKFLAKIASDMNKPRGFSIIGADEAYDFLTDKPVSIIWGVGKVFQRKLAKAGIHTIRDLRMLDEKEIIGRYGTMGRRLYHLARAEDSRDVASNARAKSISGETTFHTDLKTREELEPILWRMAEKVSGRCKAKNRAGFSITLKLKTADFRILIRSLSSPGAVYLADNLYRLTLPLLHAEIDGRPFRLLGLGVSKFTSLEEADQPDLFAGTDEGSQTRAKAEHAIDDVRAKFGDKAIYKGRSLC